ncbi:MAG: Mrr restriction system protein [Gammaproteobacteria bacterium]|nr:Mrr restriction system protein [Gammaproteobacteria bacterium]
MSKGITRERTGYLLQQLFKILLEYPDGLQAKDALQELQNRVELTEHEAGEYEGGGSRFGKIVRFATVDAAKAGWMRKVKGIWSISEAGAEALKNIPNSEDFYREASRLYRKWKKSQSDVENVEESADKELEAKITFEEAEEQAINEISAYLVEIDPYDLQDLVAALLEAMGYHVSWVSPPGKDGGIDILAFNDPLGTVPPRIKVQVKRRKDNIPVEEMRAFLALINNDDVGIFVTTGGFTKEAENIARSQETRKITLIDKQRLIDLWIEYNDNLEKDKRNLLPLKPIYFIAPND